MDKLLTMNAALEYMDSLGPDLFVDKPAYDPYSQTYNGEYVDGNFYNNQEIIFGKNGYRYIRRIDGRKVPICEVERIIDKMVAKGAKRECIIQNIYNYFCIGREEINDMIQDSLRSDDPWRIRGCDKEYNCYTYRENERINRKKAR